MRWLPATELTLVHVACVPQGCQNCDGNARLMDIRMMASSSRGKSKRSAATPTPTPALVPLDSVDGVDAATAAMLRPVRMSARHRQGTGAPATPSPVRPATTGRAVTAGALAGLRGDADVDVDGGADADATPSRRARASAAAAAARGDVDVGSAAGAGGADDGDGGSEPDDASGDSDVFLPTKAPRKRVRDRSKERARARSRVRNRSGKKAPAKAGAAQQHAVAEASLQLAIRHTQLYPDLQLQVRSSVLVVVAPWCCSRPSHTRTRTLSVGACMFAAPGPSAHTLSCRISQHAALWSRRCGVDRDSPRRTRFSLAAGRWTTTRSRGREVSTLTDRLGRSTHAFRIVQ